MLVNPFCPFTQVHNRTYDDHQRQHHYHEDADLAQAAPDGAAQELHFGRKMRELEDPELTEQAQCPEYKQRLRTSQPEREMNNFQCSMMGRCM